MNKITLASRILATTALILAGGLFTAAPAAAQVLANDDDFDVNQGGTLNIQSPGVLINDGDPERNPLTAILVSGPANAASFTLNQDGSFNYVHDGSASATDSFTYQASNGSELSNVATATINVIVTTPGPEAVNDSYTVDQGDTLTVAAPGVLANDQPGSGGPLTAVLVTPPSSHVGTFTLNADGSFNYDHNGEGTAPDSFTYQAEENGVLSGVATVSIQVGTGGPSAATVTVHFTNLKLSGRTRSLGTLTEDELGFVALSTEPAQVSGGGAPLPPSTVTLQIVTDGAAVAEVKDIFGTCEKLALLAQSRSDKYDFEVRINVADVAAILEAGAERIVVRLSDGELDCSLDRVQEIL